MNRSPSIVLAIVIVAAAWGLLVLVQDRYYRGALRLAMNARRLGTGRMTQPFKKATRARA